MIRVFSAASAEHRLAAAHRFVLQLPPASPLTIVGASRGAADDFARGVSHAEGAAFGWARFSLTEIAARAARQSGSARRMPGTQAGAEAMAARAVFDAVQADELTYFGPVASMPGFPKALARTLHELRLAGMDPERLDGDLGRLLARVEAQQDHAAIDDRAALFRGAAQACERGGLQWSNSPIVLLDVPLDSRAERSFVAALLTRAPEVVATMPEGDEFARAAFSEMGAVIEELRESSDSDLATLRRYVFTPARPPARERAGDVRLFSAPGEGRETVEIVRRVLDEASRGVPFDEMAVLLRSPQHYLGLLEHACARGGVPVYFDRGIVAPIRPAGHLSRCCRAR